MRSWRSATAPTTSLLLALFCATQTANASPLEKDLAPEQRDEAFADEPPVTDEQRRHWAFRALQRPQPPQVEDITWSRNPIDRFVLASLEKKNLKPAPAADRVTLIRRLTFLLTGLPPTPAAVQSFLRDEAPDAYQRLVDRLLASPAYGLRWGQHWLDLARFAETDGFEQDYMRPNAWRYRDWVIDALNADMPYNEFVQLQIAGDELKPGNRAALIATGFALCGPDMSDLNLVEERRHNVLNDVTSTVGAAFLGLNIGCAQCHDHKFDPISQADFYRLRAFFDNLELFKDRSIATPEEATLWEQAKVQLERDRAEVQAKIAALERRVSDGIAKPSATNQKKPADVEKARRDAVFAALKRADAERYHRLLAEQQLLKNKKVTLPPHARVFFEASATPKPSHLLVRGNFQRPGPQVLPAFPRIANEANLHVKRNAAAGSSSGRRLQLARWLTRADNPLALRVIVNRVWQHHFDVGLVATPSLFGTMGEEPTNPKLLDWLATEFPRMGWSLKRLHKLILTSATYRQASRGASEEARALLSQARKIDPEHRLLAGQRRRRLDGEEIRDALLAISGRSNGRRGGPGFVPPLPTEIRKTVIEQQWRVTPEESEHRRRSIYLFVRRNLRYPFFDVFDGPDTAASCARRMRTTIAPQSLALLNSELSTDAARYFAGRVLAASENPREQITFAYRWTLGRAPRGDELKLSETFLRDLAAQSYNRSSRVDSGLALPIPYPFGGDPYDAAAVTMLCLSLINLNEFVYVD